MRGCADARMRGCADAGVFLSRVLASFPACPAPCPRGGEGGGGGGRLHKGERYAVLYEMVFRILNAKSRRGTFTGQSEHQTTQKCTALIVTHGDQVPQMVVPRFPSACISIGVRLVGPNSTFLIQPKQSIPMSPNSMFTSVYPRSVQRKTLQKNVAWKPRF